MAKVYEILTSQPSNMAQDSIGEQAGFRHLDMEVCQAMGKTPEQFRADWKRIAEFLESLPPDFDHTDIADLIAIHGMASPEKQAIMRRRVKAGLNPLPAVEPPAE